MGNLNRVHFIASHLLVLHRKAFQTSSPRISSYVFLSLQSKFLQIPNSYIRHCWCRDGKLFPAFLFPRMNTELPCAPLSKPYFWLSENLHSAHSEPKFRSHSEPLLSLLLAWVWLCLNRHRTLGYSVTPLHKCKTQSEPWFCPPFVDLVKPTLCALPLCRRLGAG